MPQRSIACAGLVLVLLSSFAVRADDYGDDGGTSEATIGANAPQANKSRFGVGYQYGHFSYREPGLMSDSGSLNGIRATFAQPSQAAIQLRGETSFLGGSLNYAGQGWDGSPINDTMTDYLFNLRGFVGYAITGDGFTLTPEIGAGLRYLNDNGTGGGSYEREISYLYLPIGVAFESRASDRLNVGFNAEYDVFLAGRVQTHLSDVNPSYPDLTNSQSSGWGARLAANLEFKLRKLAFRVEPYFQHWAIGDSNSQAITSNQVGVEPANTSDEFGLSVMILL